MIEKIKKQLSKLFTIYDREDQKAVIKAVYKKLDINSKEFNSNKAINGISKQKSLLIKIEKLKSI